VDSARTEQIDPPASPDHHTPAQASEPREPAAEDLSPALIPGGETTLVAVPVDPHVVQCQWEVAPADIEGARRALGVGEREFWPVLQFYDVTNAAQDQAPPEPSFAVQVQLQAGNWFVRSCGPDRAYRADLALKAEDGSFKVIASSNPVQTPPSAPSSHADEHWLPIRMDPQQPVSATPVGSPIDLALEPPSGALSESAGSPARLPIDMRKEVRSILAALYSEREPDEPEPPLPTQTPLPADRREEVPESPVRLPIDMREEVRIKLGALYSEQERDEPEPPLPSQSPLPIDMREEVRELFTHLYPGLEAEPPAPTGSPLFMEETPIERVFREFHAVFPETKLSAIADLTELNERSFTSGISSRTK
jgi:hypothetical protein